MKRLLPLLLLPLTAFIRVPDTYLGMSGGVAATYFHARDDAPRTTDQSLALSFFGAINAGNWEAAAAESFRVQVQPARNTAVFNWLMDAATEAQTPRQVAVNTAVAATAANIN